MLGLMLLAALVGFGCMKIGFFPALFGIDFILEIGVFLVFLALGYGIMSLF